MDPGSKRSAKAAFLLCAILYNVGTHFSPRICSCSKLIHLKGDRMKKLLTIVFAMLLGATLSVAQATGGSTDKTAPSGKTTTSTKGKAKTKTHAKKGGTKKKKSAGGTATPAPK
jgi:hypothetical protein